jgi:aromatic-amino-acid transaminase
MLNFDGMMAGLEGLPSGSVVVLHACCHNPTGSDPTPEQWTHITDSISRRGLVPFLDMAYQGFGAGLDADAAPVRAIVVSGVPMFVAISFSKSFALYGERVGALCLLTQNKRQASLVAQRARVITRALHSSPPSNGALIVAEVVSNDHLKARWIEELEEMRLRIASMRSALVERLGAGNSQRDFSFVNKQRGLFSYSGLTSNQITALREEYAIHAVSDGRLCLAALNTTNIDRVAFAIRQVSAQS